MRFSGCGKHGLVSADKNNRMRCTMFIISADKNTISLVRVDKENPAEGVSTIVLVSADKKNRMGQARFFLSALTRFANADNNNSADVAGMRFPSPVLTWT